MPKPLSVPDRRGRRVQGVIEAGDLRAQHILPEPVGDPGKPRHLFTRPAQRAPLQQRGARAMRVVVATGEAQPSARVRQLPAS